MQEGISPLLVLDMNEKTLSELLNNSQIKNRRVAFLNSVLYQQGKLDIEQIFYFAHWTLHTGTRCLMNSDGIEVPLSSGCYNLLLIFVKNFRRVLTRDQLLTLIKNRNAEPFDRSIDVQVSRLRKKLEIDPKNPQLIKTVRTGGYLFIPEVQYQF